jgi:poly(hydroxyalkanoate) depolymerase family esterase
MDQNFPTAMREAARLTGAGRLMDATRLLQRALAGEAVEEGGMAAPDGMIIDGSFTEVAAAAAAGPSPAGQFLHRHFANAVGSRDYRLYVPGSYRGQALPLVVMLHGCTQDPEDFATGTGMNEAAERHHFLVAYPAQPASANMQKCWNWFRAQDQGRDAGEPAIIAGLARQIMAEFAVDPARVYVAGLSAGGAAAAVLGEVYPDLFAAVGVHSGLPCGAAWDVASALRAMKTGAATMQQAPETTKRTGGRIMPMIVFHGGRDGTVTARNGQAVADRAAQGANLSVRMEDGHSAGGQSYRRTRYEDDGGKILVEHWLIHSAGHAWSGGKTHGSHTDPRGPDATSEMVRFFLSHCMQV